MVDSDLASGIDDSFEVILGRTSGRRNKREDGHHFNDRRSGHWTVSDRSALGSDIDDSSDIFNFAGRRPDGHHRARTVPTRDHHISGSVLDRFAKANAADRKKERERKELEALAEEFTDIDEDQDFVREKRSEAKFYVPRIDAHRGIRIKGRDGRSEIVREPSLPPMSPPKKVTEPPVQKKMKVPRPEPARAPSPKTSVRSGSVASSRSDASNVVRIVGKDGREAFMPLPAGLGGFSTTGSETRQVQPPPQMREKDAEKERARRDAKAAKAAKEIRQEMELEEMMKSSAHRRSIVSGRSSRSSKSGSKSGSSRAPSERHEAVQKMTTAASSRTSVAEADFANANDYQKPSSPVAQKKHKKQNPKDPGPAEQPPKQSQKRQPKQPAGDKQSAAPKNASPAKQSRHLRPQSPAGWEEAPKEDINPPSSVSSKPRSASHPDQRPQFSPHQRVEHTVPPQPASPQLAWQPGKVRSASPPRSRQPSRAASPTLSQVRWAVPGERVEQTIPPPTFQPRNDWSPPPARSRAASPKPSQVRWATPRGFSAGLSGREGSTGFQAVGQVTYEPFQAYVESQRSYSSPNAHGNPPAERQQSLRQNYTDAETAHQPPVELKHPSPVRSEHSVAEALTRAYERDPSILDPSIYNNSFRAAKVERAASVAHAKAEQTAHSASVGYSISVKREKSSSAGVFAPPRSTSVYQDDYADPVHSSNLIHRSPHPNDRQPLGNDAGNSSSGTSSGTPPSGSGTPSPPFMHGALQPSSAASFPRRPGPYMSSPLANAAYVRNAGVSSHGSFKHSPGHASSRVNMDMQRSYIGPVRVRSLHRAGGHDSQGSNERRTGPQPHESPAGFGQPPTGSAIQIDDQLWGSGTPEGFMPMGSGVVSPRQSPTPAPEQRLGYDASPSFAQRPPYPVSPNLQPLSPRVHPGYGSPAHQTARQSPPRKGQEQDYTASQLQRVPSININRSPAHQEQPQTVFAGRGWISPHPLSVASSDSWDQPESTIRVPAGHPALRDKYNGGGDPMNMTYSEYQAWQKRSSVAIEHVEDRGPRQQYGEEQFQHEGTQDVGSEGHPPPRRVEEQRRERSTSRAMGRVESSHRRVSAEDRHYDQQQAQDPATVASEHSDGKVRLRMAWDRDDELDGLF
ncbi:uncharacterized protein LTR77_007984 [Saxophila tyrrhenica]|uniref:Uncharacterized protein n=1 Tax=Saxophila tyrrhenica TaxID=1690608 RepID=A0AAV9P1Y9_9PEZI|nr:hypothetical protein LTR77_007984 [Saxophila tyrrhenica]